jgi:cysteine desulfurase / selenocysteine lyase
MTLWAEVRRDFPALERYVYLDASAATPTSRVVGEAVARFYAELSQHGDLPWNGWIDEREAIRERVARFIGAGPDAIAFTTNTSSGINLIVDVLGDDGPVLASEIEFPTVTLPWIHRGIPVHFIPAPEGHVRPEDFAVDVAPGAATVALSHVQFSNGYRADLAAFARGKQGRSLVVSASQSAGAFPIDVRADGINALAVCGHKWLCAGYGTGFAYIAKEILDRRPPRAVGWMSGTHPFGFDPRTMEVLPSNRRAEMGCPAFASIFALGAAVDYLSQLGAANIASRILELNAYLTTLLRHHDFEVLSPGGPHRSGSTLVRVASADRAVRYLRSRRVLVSPKPEGVRIATHIYNDDSDVEACVDALRSWRDQGSSAVLDSQL